MNPIKAMNPTVHNFYNLGTEGIDNIAKLNNDGILSNICIDKDEQIQAMLTLSFAKMGIEPTEEMKIHAWKWSKEGFPNRYLIFNEQQHNLLLQKDLESACRR